VFVVAACLAAFVFVVGLIAAISIPSLLRARVSAPESARLGWLLEQARQAPRGSAGPPMNTEGYARIQDNPFADPSREPLSTFAIDVDTAAYSNVRRFLRHGVAPPKDAVRIEEMLNYFPKDYPQPEGEHPFSVTTEVAACPWASGHELVLVGLQGRRIPPDLTLARNLVFLIDVSGSMQDPDKLMLLQSALKLLVEQLTEKDQVALTVYAGRAGLVLPPTRGDRKNAIREAIDRLEAGGSTAGGEGILLAYRTAREMYVKGAVNRVILATDGDFNVGITSPGDLERLIETERESGVFLSVLGVGEGNLQDSTMEMLADKGNGNYSYLDSLDEAKKVLVREAAGTLVAIAKDVKIQIEFNPKRVASYRLIGYENRALHADDFADDRKDAGEIGAGHSVTALYEIVPAASAGNARGRPLRYRGEAPLSEAAGSDELLTVQLRYQPPAGGQSRLLSRTVHQAHVVPSPSSDMRFSMAVAAFGMLLRDSEHKGQFDFRDVIDLARSARGDDPEGYRTEFIELVETAARLPRG
jgi:Ca-activated chloride channel family protein